MARKRPVPTPASAPSPNLAGLIQTCKDEPDDDGLRLILADYLEDHGEPERAELVRLGIAIGRCGGPPASQPRLHAQLAQLRRAHDPNWLVNFPTATYPAWHRRGFHNFQCAGTEQARLMSCLRSSGLEHWAEGLALRFSLRETGFLTVQDEVAQTFSRLHLTLADPAVRHLRSLAKNPHAAPLRDLTLTLEGNGAGMFLDEQDNELARASFAPRLQALSIRSNDLNSDHLDLLASGAFPQLRTLRLNGGSMRVGEIPAGLRELRLESNGLNDDDVAALVRSPRAASLEILSLRGIGLTAQALRTLASSPYLSGLKRLYLGHHLLETEGLRALAASPNLNALKALDLNLEHGRIRADDLLPLFAADRFPALTDLSVRGALVDLESLGALLGGPLAPRLRRLNLDENPLGSRGAQRLAASPALTNLETLEMNHCGVGDQGLSALARSGNLDQLRWLGVASREPLDSALDTLADGAGLPALTFLRVGDPAPRRAGPPAFERARKSAIRHNLLDVESLDHLFGPCLD